MKNGLKKPGYFYPGFQKINLISVSTLFLSKETKNGVSGRDFFLMNIYFQWFLFLISVF